MASSELKLAPELDLTPSPGPAPPSEARIYTSHPETSPLGVLEDPLKKLAHAGKCAVDLVLELPARTMDLLFGNKLWP